ncbi:hypothetical protein [Nonomuraea dietziae]|uniref:hypothetical protein n=1 Tax=Nonomuraea dietziae TaxID=65515 RepID=UPI0031DFC3EE
MFRRAAELAADVGAGAAAADSRRGSRTSRWRRHGAARSTRSARSPPTPRPSGVACVLEPLQRVESNLVNDSRTLARMLDEIGSSNVRRRPRHRGHGWWRGESVDDYFDYPRRQGAARAPGRRSQSRGPAVAWATAGCRYAEYLTACWSAGGTAGG